MLATLVRWLTLWAVLVTSASLHAQVGALDPAFSPPINNHMYGIALQPDGKIIIAGESSNGPTGPRPYVSRLNQDGSRDLTFNPVINSHVYCATVQSDGKILIGGEFNTVNGTLLGTIARLNADGTLDQTFTARADFTVHNLLVQPDGKIVALGNFNVISGGNQSKVARLNSNGTLDASFNPRVLEPVRAGALQPDGKVIIGGALTTVNGTARNFVARLNADGTLDGAFNPNANNVVLAAAVQGDGNVLIGGDFTRLGTATFNRMARINANGTVDTSFNPNVNNSVYGMAVQADGKIVIVGNFTQVRGVARSSIARVNPDGTLDNTFAPTVTGTLLASVSATIQGDGKVLFGGNFTTINGASAFSVARLLNTMPTGTFALTGNQRVTWTRGGSAPETHAVQFELSSDHGATWSPLGVGTRVTGGWELAGLNLPANGHLRARARVAGGHFTGSVGIVEQAHAFGTRSLAPLLVSPAPASGFGGAISVQYVLPQAAYGGSVKLAFDDGFNTRVLTLAPVRERAGTHQFTFDPRDPAASGALSGPFIPSGLYTVSLSYRDPYGNVVPATTAANVSIDASAPVIATPAPITVEAQGLGGSRVSFAVVTLDQIDPNPVLQVSPPTGSLFPLGTTTVMARSTDAAGNAVTRTFTVTVVDTMPPIVAGNFVPLTLSTSAEGTAVVPDYRSQLAAVDVVGVASVTQSPAPGTSRGVGPVLLTLTATDAAGNAAMQNFTLQIVDGTPASIAAPLSGFTPVTLGISASGVIVLPDYRPQAVTADNVAVVEIRQSPAPGSLLDPGLYPIVLTALDDAGNESSISFNLQVNDTLAPILSAPPGGYSPLTIETNAEGVAALPDYAAQAVVKDNMGVVSVTQNPAAGSLQPARLLQVSIIAKDEAGNTAEAQLAVSVTDATNPVLAPPGGGFTPLVLIANDQGTASLPDYAAQATASDNVAVVTFTQEPPAGTELLFGSTVVTLKATDAAGNFAEQTFTVSVRLDATLATALAAKGAPVPGAGTDPRIPGGAVFTALGLPAVSDGRSVAFLARWKAGRVTGSGIFAGDPVSLVVSVGDDSPGIPGARFKSLQDPLMAADGTIAFRATVQGGVRAADDHGVWMFAQNQGALLVREGTPLPGLSVRARTILAISYRNGELLALANLAPQPSLVSAANDTALLRVTPLGATILLREGTVLDLQDGFPPAKTLKITSLIPATGSPAHGRWHGDGAAAAHVELASGRSAVLSVDAAGAVTRRAAIGHGFANLAATAVWGALEIPATDPTGTVSVVGGTLFGASLPDIEPVVTPADDLVLAINSGPGKDYTVFAREDMPAPGANGAVFASFGAPLVNDEGDVAFQGILRGKGVAPETNAGLWWGPPDAIGLVARKLSRAPDADGALSFARFSQFLSLALPSGPGAGPVFVARVTGRTVTLRNNVGIWATDATGTLRQILRTGDLIEGRSVVSIDALKAVPGALGASRGFNDRGTVAARVKLAGGGHAIIRLDIPTAQGSAAGIRGQ